LRRRIWRPTSSPRHDARDSPAATSPFGRPRGPTVVVGRAARDPTAPAVDRLGGEPDDENRRGTGDPNGRDAVAGAIRGISSRRSGAAMGIYDREYYRGESTGSGLFNGVAPVCKSIIVTSAIVFLVQNLLHLDERGITA
jgi:hypothetical protein